ncbi:hypothetical protein C6A77_03455 [Pseudomonas sp. AFG_SD02_1510_Pfu_092]|uniref:hypothetical protein n=1 Tax=Pseudomonas sp. AFG_SD02_1510_Pfu_092 TaxID=2259497 RepID=UPI000DEEC5B7|nr:hypothetical protein [Pseudomonas sp. AFG_SD02_1510_Pfu_092]RCL29125.1 hypothetical protein C6A77_03455 [Pseudomonas sp. AFG_SD02_1510_Pfu_092]
MSLAVLIVLYRKASQDSIALQSLLAQQALLREEGIDLQLYVWNNSPGVAQPCPGVHWYEADNQRLSVVYNTVAEQVFAAGVELFMISDDDTNYSNIRLSSCLAQIDRVRRSPSGDQVGVFMPRLVSHGQLVSPGKRWLFIGRLAPNVAVGLVDSRNLLGINSGLIFTRECFQRMTPFYDERLRFYATDTDFFIRYEDYFPKACVLDVEIAHDLSEHSADTPERALFRFEEMIHGLRISFHSRGLLERSLLDLYLVYAAIRKAVAYRRPAFVKALFTQVRAVK